MKRLNYSNTMATSLSMCPSKGLNERKETEGYSEEFQAMLDRLDQEDNYEDCSLVLEKKKRLSLDQVKALERNFELDNKLEPERKSKLAQQLGLQPRQVAIWFQNRRARWKTKQLERDYGILKSNYDVLKVECNNLEQDNEALTVQVRELKEKLLRGKVENNKSMKEESPISEVRDRVASESNSNGVVKEESNIDFSAFCVNGSLPSSRPVLQYSDSKGSPDKNFQTQFMRMEEQNLFSINEFCFFSVDQSPTL